MKPAREGCPSGYPDRFNQPEEEEEGNPISRMLLSITFKRGKGIRERGLGGKRIVP
jgi:hypothetical protein